MTEEKKYIIQKLPTESQIGDYATLLILQAQGEEKLPPLQAGQTLRIEDGKYGLYFAIAEISRDRLMIKIFVGNANLPKIPSAMPFSVTFPNSCFKTSDLCEKKGSIHIFSQGTGGGAASFLINQVLQQGNAAERIQLWQSSRTYADLPNWNGQYESWKKMGAIIHLIFSAKSKEKEQNFLKGHIGDHIASGKIPPQVFLYKDKCSECTYFVIGSKQYAEDTEKALKLIDGNISLRKNF